MRANTVKLKNRGINPLLHGLIKQSQSEDGLPRRPEHSKQREFASKRLHRRDEAETE